MDFHFVHAPSRVAKKADNDYQKAFAVLRRFFPVFVLAAILPFFLMFVVNPPQLGFLTQADSSPVLRVWFSPSKIVASSERDVELTLYASFDSDRELIPSADFRITSTGQAVLLDDKLSYKKPFKGQVEVGKIRVRTVSPGQAVVSVKPEDISLNFTDSKVEILSGSATITVK